MSTCINCQAEVNTNYCAACGQKNPVKKLNAINMWNDFVSRVYGFDGMFPRTLLDLTLRPGAAARAYINGNRVKYYGPVGYLFIMLTVNLLLASLLSVDMAEFTMASSSMDMQGVGEAERNLTLQINHWVVDNMRLISFLISLWSVVFIWFFFRKSTYNLIESSVIIFYVNGHMIWINIISLIIYVISGYALSALLTLTIGLAYSVYGLVNFYTHMSKMAIFFRAVLAMVISYFFMFLLAGIMGTIMMLSDPDYQKQIQPKNEQPALEQSPLK